MQRQRIAGFVKRHRGYGFWEVAAGLFLLAALMIVLLRVTPGYLEYLSVKDVVARVASESQANESTVVDVKLQLAKLLKNNQVTGISIDDIEVYRERGIIVIDARYELRFPLFWIFDGVMKFDDLLFESDQKGQP